MEPLGQAKAERDKLDLKVEDLCLAVIQATEERDEARAVAYVVAVQCRTYREFIGDARLEELPQERQALQWGPEEHNGTDRN